MAAETLRLGGLVGIPTETVYGLAANALDEAAVARIFEAKRRPSFDPLIVHLSGAGEMEKYASEIPDLAVQLAERFWPGPLTLVLPKKEIIPDLVTSGQPTVGLRVPDKEVTLELLRNLHFPLAAPSANPFGYISPTRPEHVAAQLGDEVDYILDGGPCEVGVESTIIGFEGEQPVVYRLGGTPLEELEAICGKLPLRLNLSSNPTAPGQLASHYAPRKPLYFGQVEALLPIYIDKKVAVISFTRRYPEAWQSMPLSPGGSLREAAQHLFHVLRELDASEADVILAEEFPHESLGLAINDRLRRAAVV